MDMLLCSILWANGMLEINLIGLPIGEDVLCRRSSSGYGQAYS